MKKNKTLLIISIVFFVIGIGTIFYPTISQNYNQKIADNEIDKFKKQMQEIQKTTESKESGDKNKGEKEEQKPSEESEQSSKVEFNYSKEQLDRLFVDMQKYNEKIYKEGQIGITDPFEKESPSIDLSGYQIYNNLIGFIEAPTIDMSLPMYLGANDYNMSLGAAHLSNTSLPIGGENTNAVFAGHTAYIGRQLFDKIVYLKQGDDVNVTNFWGTLKYKVVDARIIYPNETENILIQEGKDLITLTTCYPYGRNTQRYIVICERVKDQKAENNNKE